MKEVTIIGFPQSTYTRVVRMAAHEKGIDYTLDPQPPHSDPVNAIHPLGKIPVMRHGDVELAESSAIVRYFEAVFGGPRLFPVDPITGAHVEQWVSMTNSALDALLIRQYLFAYLFPKGEEGQPKREDIDVLLDKVQHALSVVADAVSDKDYLVGDSMTYADLNMYPILFYLTNTPEGGQMIADSAPLSAYRDRIGGRDSAKVTVPPPPPSAKDKA